MSVLKRLFSSAPKRQFSNRTRTAEIGGNSHARWSATIISRIELRPSRLRLNQNATRGLPSWPLGMQLPWLGREDPCEPSATTPNCQTHPVILSQLVKSFPDHGKKPGSPIMIM
jgi:hypothetical protein